MGRVHGTAGKRGGVTSRVEGWAYERVQCWLERGWLERGGSCVARHLLRGSAYSTVQYSTACSERQGGGHLSGLPTSRCRHLRHCSCCRCLADSNPIAVDLHGLSAPQLLQLLQHLSCLLLLLLLQLLVLPPWQGPQLLLLAHVSFKAVADAAVGLHDLQQRNSGRQESSEGLGGYMLL